MIDVSYGAYLAIIADLDAKNREARNAQRTASG
jgi:hypothetical protein